jgi:hypothetical protein
MAEQAEQQNGNAGSRPDMEILGDMVFTAVIVPLPVAKRFLCLVQLNWPSLFIENRPPAKLDARGALSGASL